MTLWIVLTAMIAIAAIFAAAPFIRRRERRRLESEKGLAVYRDQLKEVDAEVTQGALDPAQGDATRTEIKRRMLAVTPEPDAAWPPLSSAERSFMALGVTAVVVLGSVILFANTADLGSSSQGAAPGGASAAAAPAAADAAGSSVQGAGATSAPAAAEGGQTPLPSVDELVQRLVTRLEKNPKDVEGWRMLGWSYFNVGKFKEAAEAYGHAVDLNPDSAEYREGQIESLVRAADGNVTPEAKAAIEETLKRHADDTRALFFKAVALDQDGDRAGAEKIWTALKDRLPPTDPWAKEVAKKLGPATDAATAGDAAATAASAPTPAPSTTATKGPTADDIRAADAMSANDRSAMIRSMVNSLADRLDKSPHDADGWTRLIRSWMVLGEADKAKAALESALKAFADDPDQTQKLIAAAEQSGVKR